ncbi:MKRN2 opposite strand protein [Bulinus truncatus]|nr:MKRN2 opposite strand protein [Bulinus truncatus]
MADNYQDLRSFQHCRKDTDLVCFLLPEHCPLCHEPTATTECRIPPYILPSPFSSSLKFKRAIVLKPTLGDFIRCYTRACNLHIGITDDKGLVYDFDEDGLNQRSVWPEVLLVLSCQLGETEAWDKTLRHMCLQQAVWSKQRYHEHHWNCFDFVLNFLIHLNYPELIGPSLMSKADFCDIFLVGKTKKAEQYIHLYRQALQNGCVVIPKKTL